MEALFDSRLRVQLYGTTPCSVTCTRLHQVHFSPEMPQCVQPFVVRAVFVPLRRGGGHVEKPAVGEEEHIPLHAASNQDDVVEGVEVPLWQLDEV